MKIDNTQLNPITSTAGNLQTNAEKNGAVAKVESGATDKVSLSSKFQDLKSLGSEVGESATFDAKKVEAIKASVADGSFKVDAAKIADGLINNTKDFLSK
jgi:negative regulator of flagellin synthesis FlgM